MEKGLKFVDLFSGIGGIRQGFERNGHEAVAFSEIDKYAIKAYKTLYGEDDRELGDVSAIPDEELSLLVNDVDLVIGGSPCQAFSVAGGRGGFDDTRGSLFFEYCRVLKQTQPKYFLFENVKGVLSHDKGQTIDTMIRAFNEVGYTVDLNLLNSKYFGVPQNRERIFVVGVRSDLIENEEWIALGGGVLAQGRKRLKEAGDIKTFNFDWPQQVSVDTRLRDVLESEVDEKYYISEEKTAKLIAELKEREMNSEYVIIDPKQSKREGKCRLYPEVAPTLTARDYKEPNMVGHKKASLDQPSPVMVGMIETKGNESIRRVYGVNGVCNTLTTMQGGNREPKIAVPQEFSDGSGLSYCIDASYAKGISPGNVGKGRRTHAIEVLATLTPERVERRQQGRRFNVNDEPSFTLTALDRHGVTIEESSIYRIRKLTPLECWRLQSFSDEDFYKVKDSGMSDSQLYKQAGNCVTINVIDAIAKNMTSLHNQLEEKSLSFI